MSRSYVRGEHDAWRRVESWIRSELRSRYPALAHEAEDLAQVVHMKLVQNLRQGRFRGDSSLRSYVTGIVHYSAIDRLRQRYRDRDLAEAWSAHLNGPPSRGPYQTLETDETTLLYRALTSLPPRCRQLWKMVLIDRLSYDEIGRRIGVPSGTVKSRMWHCRRKAMEALQKLRRQARPQDH